MTDFAYTVEVVISNDLLEARRIQREIEEALHAADYCDRDIFCAKLALEEALVNAVKHGNRMDPAKHVTVRYDVNAERFLIQVCDEGDGFDPDAVPDPTAPENIERPCGRGILLMRRFMSVVAYDKYGNRVVMTKLRTAE